MIAYLVTGGAGFIGSNFVIYLLNKYQNIKVIMLDKLTYAADLDNLGSYLKDERLEFVKGDICDKNIVESIFDKTDIKYVVNFAAESHVDKSIEGAEEFVITNVFGTVNLLTVAKKYWEKDLENHKFIQISTDEVYGELQDVNSLFVETNPINPRNPYAASKASADFFVKSFHETHKIPINITRCSNNYGKHQHVEKLIPKTILSMLKNEPVTIYGDGNQIRDWLFVEEHCSAIDLVVHNGRNGEIYNIGGNNEISNIDVVNYIGKYLINKNIIKNYTIKYVADRKGHDRRYGMCFNKMHAEFGWQPSKDNEKNIGETIDWYCIKLQKLL